MEQTESLSKFDIQIVKSKNIEQTSRDIIKAIDKTYVTSLVKGICLGTTAVGIGGFITAAAFSLSKGNIEILPILKGIEVTSCFIGMGGGIGTAYLPTSNSLVKKQEEAENYLNLRSKILKIGGIHPWREDPYYNIIVNGVRLHRKNATSFQEKGLNEYVEEAYQIYDEITTNHLEKDPVLQKKLEAYHIVRK